MSDSVGDLRGSETILNFMSTYRADGFFSTIAVVAIGTAVTMIVQSSSATMAMTMALAVSGLIDFYTAASLILGENIGTTITANIAAIGSTVEARRTARVHFLFNFLGVIWILTVMKAVFIPCIDMIVPGNPFSPDLAERSRVIADHMAAFHTGFNIINTLVFLPFVKYLAKAAEFLVKHDDKTTNTHLMYITTNVVSIPSININQARLEIERMTEIVNQMFAKMTDVLFNPDKKPG
jgi:phosphate:Na+ symporter